MSAGFIGTFGNLLGSKSALLLKSRIKIMSDSRPSSDLAKFRSVLKESKNVLILSGAGMSAESGIPTFRGEGGYWRTYVAANLDTPQAFKANPSLVWEFYHYRRELARLAQPNPGHIAVAEFERKSLEKGRYVTLVTQNFDNLHARAGSLNIVELHGNLYKTRCTKCNNIEVNNDSPICEALRDKGAPDPNAVSSDIPLELLPRCKVLDCGGLLRPHVVWFGEILEEDVLDRAHAALSECDVCLIIGTSSVVYPAAMFAPQAASRGIPVAEFNIEATPVTENFGYYFQGGNVAFIKIEDGKAWIKFQVENTAKEVFEKCTDSKLKVEDNKLEVSLLLEKRNRSSSIKWFLGELMERRQKQNGGKQYFNRNRQCSSF